MKIHSLRLGGCTSRAEALYKIQAWGKNAKSFTIISIIRYWYGVQNKHLNTFRFEIEYYSKKNEGRYQIPIDKVGILCGASRRKHGGNFDKRTIIAINSCAV